VKHSLTLSQAVELALKQNSVLYIARAKVTESDQKIVSTRAQYFPLLSNNTKYMALSDKQLVTIPAGSLGNVGGGPFPNNDVKLSQSRSTVLYSETTLAQPTTQLLKIHEANQIARADRGIAEAELSKSENETVLVVHQLYYALLIAGKEREAAQASLAAAQENQREAEDAVMAGNLLDVAITSAKANLLQGRQVLITAENRISDLTSELIDLLGCQATPFWKLPRQACRSFSNRQKTNPMMRPEQETANCLPLVKRWNGCSMRCAPLGTNIFPM